MEYYLLNFFLFAEQFIIQTGGTWSNGGPAEHKLYLAFISTSTQQKCTLMGFKWVLFLKSQGKRKPVRLVREA